jgi:hypothetical protein
MSELGHAPPSTNDAAQSPAKDPGGPSPGTGSALAALAVEDQKQQSTGQPLPAATQGKMEGAFGADFSNVKVHADGAAAQAAKGLDAQAFAEGSDIFFDHGKYAPGTDGGDHLIAHELAHVVQTGGSDGAGVAPKGNAGASGTAVSAVGDAAEHAADQAADRAVKGEPVGSVGSAPASTIHRDAIGELKDSADGNWLGSVDDGKVLAKVRALSAADKAAVRTDKKYDGLKRRIMNKLATGNCLQFFVDLGGFDLRWKLYWLNEGSKLDDLNASQWQWLVGYASPQVMDQLRVYPTGYKAFLKNAPLEMIAPWDRLQGLEDGTWHGSATDVRNAVANLNPDQKAKVRADNNKIWKILHACGDVTERFRVITYLEFKVKFAIFWLDSVKQLPSLTQQQWSQLLSECSRADYDELVGWGAMWALVQKHCPPAILQVTRQNSDPAVAANAFEDPVQVNTMFATLGPAGFLAAATKDPVLVDHIYVKARGKVIPTVDGLPTGAQMGAQSKANLREWFFTASSNDAECQKMFERRFRVHTTGLGTYDHTHDAQGNVNSVQLNPFTKVGLTSMWQVCETLPPAAVENNPRLMNILRDRNNGTGNAYYAGPEQGSKGDILMGYQNDANLQNNKVGGNQDNIYQDAAGNPNVNIREFNATLRHEIGHAVDAQLNVMASWMHQDVAGGWIQYKSYTEFVDAIIAAAGGMHYGSADLNKKYRQGMIDAVSASPQITFSAALTAKGVTPPAANPGGPVGVVWTPGLYGPGGGNGPWYDHNWVTTAGRNFQDSYGSVYSLYSFKAAVRTARKVTDYQWRAPGEWFAEAYQVYYSETEGHAPNTPQAPVGGRLRSRDPEAAQMLSQIVDRGYSPQDLRGGGTAKTPGT